LPVTLPKLGTAKNGKRNGSFATAQFWRWLEVKQRFSANLYAFYTG
jgi:hypothetical protein